MPPRKRRNITAEAAEGYASAAAELAEAVVPQETDVPKARPDLPAHRNRAKTGIKGPGMNFRYNASQRQLLDYAVAMEDMTKQELIEQLVWPILEERYGDAVPIVTNRF